MLTWLAYAALLLVAAVVLLVAVASRRPDRFSISREVMVRAPAEAIFHQINRFPAWQDWSPWDKIDPDLKRSYGGPAAGVGSTYGWQGNGKVGSGRMEIIEAEPSRTIAIRLNFEKPMRAENMAVFTLTPKGEETHVDWTMTGASPLVSKIFGLIFNLDRMIGRDFEKGLAQLKSLAERG